MTALARNLTSFAEKCEVTGAAASFAADAVAGTAALHAQFEAFIRQAPEQWMWAHRKWV